MRLSERALFLLDFLDLEAATGVEGARWEYFQLQFLSDESLFRIRNKSRQIAFSWLIAAEAVAEAILEGQSSIFVSINQDEATEKLRYARAIIESLRPDVRPRIARDNSLIMELSNKARLISHSSRPPRGKARMNVYLDEFAHAKDDAAIYTAALPITSKGGRMALGSSPMGASGRFWEIDTESMQRYPGYTRASVAWWETYAFSVKTRAARKLAPSLPTMQRVEMFGNERIKAIYANMPEDDFRQEYECEYVDESTAWITWEEIRANQHQDLICRIAKGVEAGKAAIDEIAQLAVKGEIESVFFGGVDIGRTRDATEITLTGRSTVNTYPVRVAITLEKTPFTEQASMIAYTLDRLRVARLLIDRNGIGRQIAEQMEQAYPSKALGVDFTNASKLEWATHAKMLIQQNRATLPTNRDIAYQIHSIKKLVSASRNVILDTARNEKHHADKFWAWALSLSADRADLPDEPVRTMPAMVHDAAMLR